LTALPDVNVLVALAWPNHIHHQPAREWFLREGLRNWATCPLTQAGFVRVSSNPRVLSEARSPAEAMALLGLMLERGNHAFWSDEVHLLESPWVRRDRIFGHRQVTDAHLLAIAVSHGGRLATFDTALVELVPTGMDPAHVLILLPYNR
jgi:toxin-antitoxin system PIN domain toxin